jgi:TPR repeat protein
MNYKKLLISLLLIPALISCAEEGSQKFRNTLAIAEQGDAEAQYAIGVMYHAGWEVTKDYAEEIRWWLLAAEQGHSAAMFQLGYHYWFGGEGVTQNGAEAIRWMRLAAEHGERDAILELGGMYYRGGAAPNQEAGPPNYIQAYVWERVAVDMQGRSFDDSEGLFADKFTPAQLAQAQELATRCIESEYQDCD